jgi:hypothetical protein
MASARLLKSLIKPVMQRHPNLTLFDNKLCFQPIGWYLRGCIFGRSRSAESVYLYRFVIPLFEPRIRGTIGWGGRMRTRAGSEGWDVDADGFLAEFEWAFETEIAPHVENISTGEDFKLYMEKKLDNISWTDVAIAMGCLHMGQLTEAKAILEALFDKYGARFPKDDVFWMPHARMIIHMIDTDPLGLEAKLIATAVQTAENFKITKFWTQPEKFWAEPPQLP